MKTAIFIVIIIVIVAAILFFMDSQQTNSTDSQVTLVTSLGEIEIELFTDKAPLAAQNFIKLAGEGFYNGTQFHRVIPDFMVQGGDPLTKEQPQNLAIHGTGGPGYTFADEQSGVPITRGVLAMANAGPNTNGSQFFIVTAPATPHLDGIHTAFGRVTKGMEVVDAISAVERNEKDHPLENVVLERVVVE